MPDNTQCFIAFLAGVGSATGLMLLLQQRKQELKEENVTSTPGTKMVQAVTGGKQLNKKQIIDMRADVSSKAQSVSYANTNPLLMMSGKGQYLYDETGAEYLDTRNNVCHVGHANAAVADAVSRQVRSLNTNTRYLHPNHVMLATRLRATFPAALATGKVFFVNSGSEANDLALRLARAHTNNKQTIVVSHAYHGHTCEVIGISPYKYKYGNAGDLAPAGRPDWVTEVAAPDTYRGKHRGDDAATLYAEEVRKVCAENNGKVGAFFIESGMSVAGVIVPPVGYLQQCYAAVRAAGGVCVADEVQTGLGRTGHWWAFEEHPGVVPDIVTLGKPFGNGMPLAAVVCTAEVARSFADGPEYFNTFGGNPVCCAAGLAVLDEIERLGLRQHAYDVGEYLREQVRQLRHTDAGKILGQVRGAGLFIGIELVNEGEGDPPATKETSWLCSRLKDVHQILTSVDGPHDNVLVLKPPMVFSKANVDTFVGAIMQELGGLADVDLSAVEHTPT